MSCGVLAVVTNWRRPQNVPRVLAALRAQTVQPTGIVVCDNSPPGVIQEEWPNPYFELADDVWRIGRNQGCSCRLAVAAMATDYKYVLFLDDDRVPGKRAIEFLLEHVDAAKDCFATIGAANRLFDLSKPAGSRYSGYSFATRGKGISRVHLTCQGHLFRSLLFHFALSFRSRLLHKFGAEAESLVKVHEDMLVCLGIQMETGWPSLASRIEDDPEQQLQKDRLPEDHACWRRPTHFAERNRMVDMALEVGWRPVT